MIPTGKSISFRACKKPDSAPPETAPVNLSLTIHPANIAR